MDRGGAVAPFAFLRFRRWIRIGERSSCSGRTWRGPGCLAGALLEIGAGSEVVSLDELALPFASRIAEHLHTMTSRERSDQSRFLDACRAYNSGELDTDGLRAKTVQLGFANVIDAFHVVDKAEIPDRFFVDERSTGSGIRLRGSHLRELLDEGHGP